MKSIEPNGRAAKSGVVFEGTCMYSLILVSPYTQRTIRVLLKMLLSILVVTCVGDVVTMVSATFGEDMWTCRGVGLSRVLSCIQVRHDACMTPDSHAVSCISSLLTCILC